MGLTRRRRRDAAVVDLTSWNDPAPAAARRRGRPASLTPIARPDDLHPEHHPLPTAPPDQAHARRLVEETVAGLADRGALDAGTPDVLDHWIDRQLSQWETAVEDQAASRRRTAERLHAVHTENLVRERAELADLTQRLDEARRVLARWLQHLDADAAREAR